MGQNLDSVLCCHVFNLLVTKALSSFVTFTLLTQLFSSSAQGPLDVEAVWSQSGSRCWWYSWRPLPINNGTAWRKQSLSHFCLLQELPWASPGWSPDTLHSLPNSSGKLILTNTTLTWNKQVDFSSWLSPKHSFLSATLTFPPTHFLRYLLAPHLRLAFGAQFLQSWAAKLQARYDPSVLQSLLPG